MTVKLLIDWPDSRNGRQYVAGNLLTTDAGTESGLVTAKLADTTLTGGTAYVAPAVPLQYKDAQLAVDAGGIAIGLSGGTPAEGVFFGPPASFFRLRMRCSGGSAVVTVVASRRSGGSDSSSYSLQAGSDVSESIYADDYASLVWTSVGTGIVTVEVI